MKPHPFIHKSFLLFFLLAISVSLPASAQRWLTVKQVFNFNAGDIFEYKGMGFDSFSKQLEVLSVDSSIHDSLIYKVRVRSHSAHDFESSIVYLRYGNLDSMVIDSTMKEDADPLGNGYSHKVNYTAFGSRRVNGYYDVNTTTIGPAGHYHITVFADGLGEVKRRWTDHFSPSDNEDSLVYYKKGNQEWGQEFFASIAAGIPSGNMLTSFPNPIKQQGTLTVQGIYSPAQLSISDASGQILDKIDLTPSLDGNMILYLAQYNIPRGLILLHVTDGRSSRYEKLLVE